MSVINGGKWMKKKKNILGVELINDVRGKEISIDIYKFYWILMI